MNDTYQAWIQEYLSRFVDPRSCIGRCKEAATEMAAAFIGLRLVRGHVTCPEPWGRRGHWWCETADGGVVDPTAAQFTSGILMYEEYVEGDDIRLGSCMHCGDGIWGKPMLGSRQFCGSICERKFAEDLT